LLGQAPNSRSIMVAPLRIGASSTLAADYQRPKPKSIS